MSLDLFAAFGDQPQEASSKPHRESGSSVWTSTSIPHDSTKDRIVSHSNLDDIAPVGTDDGAFEDDDFGDFEDASATATWTPKPSKQNVSAELLSSKDQPTDQDSRVGKHPFAGHMDFLFEPGEDEYDAGEDDLANLAKDPEAAMAFSKRLIAEQEARSRKASPAVKNTETSYQEGGHGGRNQVSEAIIQSKPQHSTRPTPSSGPPPRRKLQKKSGYVPAKDPNVLFDADDLSEHGEDDDDDFGDFEDGVKPPVEVVKPKESPIQRLAPAMASMDLLGFDDNLKPITHIGRSRGDSIRKAEEILGPTKSRTSSLIDDAGWDDLDPQPPAQNPTNVRTDAHLHNDEDAWDDFESSEPITQPLESTLAPPQILSPTQSSSTASQSTLPPTNIPPPAVLLSIFPSILLSAQDALFNPLSRLDQAQKQQLLAHAASQQFLRAHLEVAIVLARIIAGRKLRWKRDQILSQSMRIGQAGAGGRSGMKLTGVDKGEATKEEQEALEAVRMWKAQAGKLRGAVTAASSITKLPPIPEINEQMPVRVLKAVEGGFTAPHACALCGLKREERVFKVDVDVNDSFGEWWVQAVDMHLACRKWWDQHKNKLKSR